MIGVVGKGASTIAFHVNKLLIATINGKSLGLALAPHGAGKTVFSLHFGAPPKHEDGTLSTCSRQENRLLGGLQQFSCLEQALKVTPCTVAGGLNMSSICSIS